MCVYRWRVVPPIFFLYPSTVRAGGPSRSGCLAVAPSGCLRVRTWSFPRVSPARTVARVVWLNHLTDHVFGVCSLRAPAHRPAGAQSDALSTSTSGRVYLPAAISAWQVSSSNRRIPCAGGARKQPQIRYAFTAGGLPRTGRRSGTSAPPRAPEGAEVET